MNCKVRVEVSVFGCPCHMVHTLALIPWQWTHLCTIFSRLFLLQSSLFASLSCPRPAIAFTLEFPTKTLVLLFVFTVDGPSLVTHIVSFSGLPATIQASCSLLVVTVWFSQEFQRKPYIQIVVLGDTETGCKFHLLWNSNGSNRVHTGVLLNSVALHPRKIIAIIEGSWMIDYPCRDHDVYLTPK